MNKTIEQNIREENCYGCTIEQMKTMFEQSITFRLSGPAMVCASLMSDAQEEISMGMPEEARKTLNRAKWVLSEYVDWKAKS